MTSSKTRTVFEAHTNVTTGRVEIVLDDEYGRFRTILYLTADQADMIIDQLQRAVTPLAHLRTPVTITNEELHRSYAKQLVKLPSGTVTEE